MGFSIGLSRSLHCASSHLLAHTDCLRTVVAELSLAVAVAWLAFLVTLALVALLAALAILVLLLVLLSLLVALRARLPLVLLVALHLRVGSPTDTYCLVCTY